MTRPLKIKYSGATAIGLQEMTDAEIDYSAHQICAKMASQVNSTGNLAVKVDWTGTSIGSFIDTYRPDAVGSHPVGTTINSTTTTFRQNMTVDTTEPTRPLEWSSSAMREMNDSAMNSYIFNRVLARLSSLNVGAYVLQPSAPVGGTWTSVATITDTASSNTTTYLWRCISSTAPTAVRPVKRTGGNMQEMNDTELQNLFGKYTTYVTSTGVGKYAVQSAAPVGGTWVRMGSSFDDTINQVSNVSYTGSYAGSYSGSYTGYYAGSRTYYYTGYYAGSRTYYYSSTYATAYVGYFYSGYAGAVGGVEGYYNRNFAGSRAKAYTANYAGSYSSTFSTSYAGAYAGSYAGSRDNTYTGLTVISTKDTPSNISLWLRTA